MSYKLTPRFFYTLKGCYYFLFWQKDSIQPLLLNNKNVLFFNSARVGLRLLLSSYSTKKIKVGIQAYTCHTVFQAIKNAGHEIVFIDITDNLKLDLVDLSRKIKFIDVLIVTHTFGFPENMDEIKKIVGDTTIIEDCSHSFLSKYKGEYTGNFGDAAIFSMGLGKFPPIGSGGFCLINSTNKFSSIIKEDSKIHSSTFISSLKDYVKLLLCTLFLKPPLYGAVTYKIGKRVDSLVDFTNKFSFIERRGYKWAQRIFLRNFLVYEKMLIENSKNAETLKNLIKFKTIIPQNNENSVPNNYIFPLQVVDRDKIFKALISENIEPGKHFHKSIEWAAEFGYVKGECPNSEALVNQILTVPIHSCVTSRDIEKMAKIINENGRE